MGSSYRLFSRGRSVHEIFGGGFVADVILWREHNVTVGILLLTLASWVVFEKSGYTLLSLASSVLLLLVVILFLWAKSAALLNRPAPPLPELHLSEETVKQAAVIVGTHVNALLSAFQEVALGNNNKLFFEVALCLFLTTVAGSLTDMVTLGYAVVLFILTIPVMYERYEDYVDKHVIMLYRKAHQLYVKVDVECVGRAQNWFLEMQKLS